MNVLVIGAGGREHALAWRVAQSDRVNTVFVAPGNAGTSLEPGIENVDIPVMDFDELIRFAKNNGVELTIVGPEDPLVGGIVDRFASAGLRCFGPGAAAAQLEGSKSFTKAFLKRHDIPTAGYEVFDDPGRAVDYSRQLVPPIVIKADGLAAGKGVVIARDHAEAEKTIREMLDGAVLAGAGSTIVIEEFLAGEEASYIVLADGENFLPFASSQDHKAAYDGDLGPNTGGMGAYSPAPVVTPEVDRRIVEEVIRPTIDGLKSEGMPYTGFLYAGLMIDSTGAPRVIEFNCRFGDPETQPIMVRLETDLVDLVEAALDGRLSDTSISFDNRAALTVVMASGGYPGSYEKGQRVSGLSDGPDTKIFHAGTSLKDGEVVTSGGRVLGITALGDSVMNAKQRAYQVVEGVTFDNAEFRRDIGYRAIAREQAVS